MKRFNFQNLTLVLLVSILVLACRKNQDKNDAAEIAQQSSLGQRSMSDLGVMASEAISGPFKTFAATCIDISHDTTGTTKIITIDFGTTACICLDGKSRKGKVLVTTNGTFNAIGEAHKITISTSDYYVSNNKIVGTRVITRINTDNTKIVSNATVTLDSDRGVFTWNGDFNRQYVSGDDTPYLSDDEYLLTGKASGLNTKEIEYNLEIIDPLEIQTGCRWIKGGVLKISSPSMKDDATLDYGDGYCDDKALLKYKKKEKELTL